MSKFFFIVIIFFFCFWILSQNPIVSSICHLFHAYIADHLFRFQYCDPRYIVIIFFSHFWIPSRSAVSAVSAVTVTAVTAETALTAVVAVGNPVLWKSDLIELSLPPIKSDTLITGLLTADLSHWIFYLINKLARGMFFYHGNRNGCRKNSAF